MNILVIIQSLKNQDKMNYIIIILNRVYFFLVKVKNQSPFLGAVILVSLIISVSLYNIQLLIYTFMIESIIIDNRIFFLGMLIIFFILYTYAKKKKTQIMEQNINYATVKNIVVASFFLFTIVSTIFLANINREKISKERQQMQSKQSHKESLESKVRKWFE
jgi:hypothetical protein